MMKFTYRTHKLPTFSLVILEIIVIYYFMSGNRAPNETTLWGLGVPCINICICIVQYSSIVLTV